MYLKGYVYALVLVKLGLEVVSWKTPSVKWCNDQLDRDPVAIVSPKKEKLFLVTVAVNIFDNFS